MPFLEHSGYCPICQAESVFVAEGSWLRNEFKCPACQSIPRQRAFIVVLDRYCPDWRARRIHESSPVWSGSSEKLRRECPGYSCSYFDPAQPTGSPHPGQGWQNEDLERLSFRTASFDVVVTQDVFEHLFEPHLAIAEIARVLKPGGMHICTVPITRGAKPSLRRARRAEGSVEHILPSQHHGNPIDDAGSLVTFDWGFDIGRYLDRHSGMQTTIVTIDDINRGISAEAIEVLVMHKLADPAIL